MSPATLLTKLNELGKANGIGRLDLVENRFVGMKSRGIYETPGGTILYAAHRGIESITLDRGAGHLKDELMPKYAELIYYGFWYSPEREMLQALIDKSQENVTGTVRLKLYKGNTTVVGRKSPKSLYSMQHVTFEDDAGRLQPARRRRLHQAECAAPAAARAWGRAGPRADASASPISIVFSTSRPGSPRSRRSGSRAAGCCRRRRCPPTGSPIPAPMPIAAGAGALCGAMFFGTSNTWLSGVHALGFSMVGGLAGAIAAIEAFKRITGITGSTGIAFAAPFAATVAVGRIGCFFAGLDDYTYGTPTGLPWGVDFGDGIRRHPVQLYEALSMAAMFVVLLR